MDLDYVGGLVRDWESIHGVVNVSRYAVAVRLIRAGRLLDASLAEPASVSDLSVRGDYEVLAAIRRKGNRGVTPTQLASSALVTTAGMTGRLDRLESAGLIVRKAHREDRRSVQVTVTPRGERVADTVFWASLAASSRLLGVLTDEETSELGRTLAVLLHDLGDTPPSSQES
jgi:DNA-binding MarR family transcriptional regulator